MADIRLKTLVLVCTLSSSPKPSSSELLAGQLLQRFRAYGVEGELITAAAAPSLPSRFYLARRVR